MDRKPSEKFKTNLNGKPWWVPNQRQQPPNSDRSPKPNGNERKFKIGSDSDEERELLHEDLLHILMMENAFKSRPGGPINIDLLRQEKLMWEQERRQWLAAKEIWLADKENWLNEKEALLKGKDEWLTKYRDGLKTKHELQEENRKLTEQNIVLRNILEDRRKKDKIGKDNQPLESSSDSESKRKNPFTKRVKGKGDGASESKQQTENTSEK